jgi:hypothetical protein
MAWEVSIKLLNYPIRFHLPSADPFFNFNPVRQREQSLNFFIEVGEQALRYDSQWTLAAAVGGERSSRKSRFPA